MTDHDEQTAPATETTGARPAVRFSGSGGLTAAVWKQKTENGSEHYSIKLERSYRKGEGEFESTPYLREGDLLRAQKLLSQVDDWVEQDRAQGRGRGQQSLGSNTSR